MAAPSLEERRRGVGSMRRFPAPSTALFLCGLTAFVFSGCLATRQEIEDLRGDIIRLQSTLGTQQKTQTDFQGVLKENQEALQGNQADLMAKMGDLSHRLEALSSQLVESDNRMASLSTRLDDLDKNVTNRLDAVVKTVQGVKTIPAPSPSRFYQAGYAEFTKKRYAQAIQVFQTYLDQYPDTERAPQAQYYIGESHLAEKNYEEALDAFDAVIQRYSKSSSVAGAYLQKGRALEELGKPTEAAVAYETVVKKFSHRKEAQTAADRLRNLRGEPVAPSPKPKPKAAPKPAAKPAPKTSDGGGAAR